MDLKGRSFLTLLDFNKEEIRYMLDLAHELKAKKKKGILGEELKGKNIVLVFDKSSTRTRCSFEVAAMDEGAHVTYLTNSHMNKKESIEDTAKVFGRMYDAIEYRGFGQEIVEELAKYGSVPVINGLTDLLHPCQVLADLLTIYEHKKALKGLKLAYLGDGNNMAHSLLIGCSKVGMDVAVGCPEGYMPEEEIVRQAQANAQAEGSRVLITSSPQEAVEQADVVYADVWASMGQEAEQKKREKIFPPYQVNKALFSLAKPGAIFLHCLPAHRGEEVTSDVIDSDASVIFDEAENRLHAQKAVMALLMGEASK